LTKPKVVLAHGENLWWMVAEIGAATVSRIAS
jgi:hypothetical protein